MGKDIVFMVECQEISDKLKRLYMKIKWVLVSLAVQNIMFD